VRILLVGPTHPFRGGIAHHTTLLAGALRDRCELTFVSYRRLYIDALYPGTTDRDASNDAIASEHVEHVLDTLAPWTFYALGRRARGFDAIVLPWWVAFWAPYYLLVLAGLRRRARVVFVCHNVIEHEPSAVKRAATRAVLSRGDAFVVQSREEAERLRELVGPRAIAVSPHPPYDVFDCGRYTRASARASLGIAPDDEVVLSFGFIRPYKGIDVLLAAMPAVIAARPRARLLVVGEVWGDDAKLRAAAGERCTLVLEYVPNEDVERYVKAADVMALPYTSGSGSGIAQIALAMRVPVVATAIGTFTDVLDRDRLVPPGDPAALAAALVEALAHPRPVEAPHASWDALAETIIGLARRPAGDESPTR